MPFELLAVALLMAGLDNDEDKHCALQLYHDYKGLFYKVALQYLTNAPRMWKMPYLMQLYICAHT